MAVPLLRETSLSAETPPIRTPIRLSVSNVPPDDSDLRFEYHTGLLAHLLGNFFHKPDKIKGTRFAFINEKICVETAHFSVTDPQSLASCFIDQFACGK